MMTKLRRDNIIVNCISVLRLRDGHWGTGGRPLDDTFGSYLVGLRQFLSDRLVHDFACFICGRHDVVDHESSLKALLLFERAPPRQHINQIAFVALCNKHCAARDYPLTNLAMSRLKVVGRFDGSGSVFTVGGDGSVHAAGSPISAGTGRKPDHGSGSSGKPEQVEPKKEDER
jgi:hypothetical protein